MMAGTYVIPPRPADPGGELALSAVERAIELVEIGGLPGVRALRRRLAAARALKAAGRGRRIRPDDLDRAAGPAVPRTLYAYQRGRFR